jgi:RIO kinase 1
MDDFVIAGAAKAARIRPEMIEQYTNHLNFDVSPNRFVDTALFRIEAEELRRRQLRPGRDYRRTEDQVLDNRTKIVLFKLLSRHVLQEINGCISTGKEGNVYIGVRGENAPDDWPAEFAVKIYKTCILRFKDRDRYVAGEMRFQHKAGGRNSRKNVILWAEKEFRNLSRLHGQQIPSPRPLLVKANILFMELVTQDSLPAPLLREATLELEDYERIYKQILIDMRHIYHRCNLVHADLSEYNLLVRDQKVVWIDVGQSVEHDNPNSTIFLRRDIATITKYFQAMGIKTAPLMRTFEFVVEQTLVTDVHWVLREIRSMEEDMGVDEFLGVFIPQRLDEVTDPELEVMDLEDGILDQAALHGALTGVVPSELALPDGEIFEAMEEEDEPDAHEDDAGDEEEDDGPPRETLDRKLFSKEDWKAKVKEIKGERREKRKTKTPKVEKRRLYRRTHPNAK